MPAQPEDAPPMEASPLAVYQSYLDKGELAYQWSPAAERAVFYPRLVCPYSGTTDLEWVRAEHGAEVKLSAEERPAGREHQPVEQGCLGTAPRPAELRGVRRPALPVIHQERAAVDHHGPPSESEMGGVHL